MIIHESNPLPKSPAKKKKKPRPTTAIFQSSGWLHITFSSKTTSPFFLIIYRPPKQKHPQFEFVSHLQKKVYLFTRPDPIRPEPRTPSPEPYPMMQGSPQFQFFFSLRPHAFKGKTKERKKRKKPALFTRPPQHSNFWRWLILLLRHALPPLPPFVFFVYTTTVHHSRLEKEKEGEGLEPRGASFRQSLATGRGKTKSRCMQPHYEFAVNDSSTPSLEDDKDCNTTAKGALTGKEKEKRKRLFG